MKQQKHKSTFSKLTTAMAWLMLAVTIGGSVLPPSFVLADEAGQAVAKAHKVKKDSSKAEQTQSSTATTTVSSDSGEIIKPVEKALASVDENSEEQANAPNEVKKAQNVKTVTSDEDHFNDELNQKILDVVKEFEKTEAGQHDFKTIYSQLDSKEFKEANGLRNKLTFLSDSLLIQKVSKELSGSDKFYSELTKAETNDARLTDLDSNKVRLEFSVDNVIQSTPLGFNSKTNQAEPMDGKQLVTYFITIKNAGSEDIALSAYDFSAAVGDSVVAINDYVTGVYKETMQVNTVAPSMQMIAKGGISQVSASFLLDKDQTVDKLYFSRKDQKITINLKEDKSILDKVKEFFTGSDVNADMITWTDKIAEGIWRHVDSTHGGYIYCIDHGLNANQNQVGFWSDAKGTFSIDKINELATKFQILQLLGYDPNQNATGTAAYQTIAWAISDGVSMNTQAEANAAAARYGQSGTIQTLVGQTALFYKMLGLRTTWDQASTDKGFAVGYNGEMQSSGMTFSKPYDPNNPMTLRMGETLTLDDRSGDVIEHIKKNQADVAQNDVGKYGLRWFLPNVGAEDLTGKQTIDLFVSVANGLTSDQSWPFVSFLEHRQQYLVMVPFGTPIDHITAADIARSEQFFTINDVRNGYDQNHNVNPSVKIKDPAAIAKFDAARGSHKWQTAVYSHDPNLVVNHQWDDYEARIFTPTNGVDNNRLPSEQRMLKYTGELKFMFNNVIDVQPLISTGIEKSISYHYDGEGKRLLTDGDAKAMGVDFTRFTFELHKEDGSVATWEDKSVVVDGSTKVSKGSKASTSGAIKVHPDANGDLEVNGLVYGSYTWKEVETSPITKLGPTRTEVVANQSDANKSDSGNLPKSEYMNNDEGEAEENDPANKGFINELKTFSFKAEKSIMYNNKLIIDADAKKYGIDLTQTRVGLFKNGQPVQWSDRTAIGPDFKIKKGTYAVNGQSQITKPTSGPVEFFMDASGELAAYNLIWGTYELRELHQPEGTYYKYVTTRQLDPTTATEKDEDKGEPMLNLLNNEEGKTAYTDSSNKGLSDQLKTLGFNIEKSVVMTGSKQEHLTAQVAQDSPFSEGAQTSLEKEKVDMTKAVYELRHKNGTPVKWSDTTMQMFRPTTDVIKGKAYPDRATVQFSPDANGELEVHQIVQNENDFVLAEVETPNRTNLDSAIIDLNEAAPEYGREPYITENYDNDHQNTKGFMNNVDYTGVKLMKQQDYLGTQFGSEDDTYDAQKDTLGVAHFAGAQYTLYYGDGPKKDQPVLNGDYVVEKMLTGNVNGATTTKTSTGPIVFTVQSNGLVAIIDNIVYGSYYLLETKAAPGMHLDKTRYYFGDKATMPEKSQYLAPQNYNANSKGIGATDSNAKDISAAKESQGITTDDTKLISDELEKRSEYLNTPSPFQSSTRPTWGSANQNSVTYKYGDISVDYIRDGNLFGDAKVNDLGATRRSQAVYGLFYAFDTMDGQGKKDQPVKWNDRVVEHMKVVYGVKISNDYTTGTGKQIHGSTDVTIRLSDAKDSYAKLKVKDIAYHGFYWKELEAPAGMAIDFKEYKFGATYDDKVTYVSNDKVEVQLDDIETQTNLDVSTSDTKANHHFDNTFKSKPYGSTDTIATFGFSSSKIAKSATGLDANGENGVEITLTPLGDTLGDPITTVTKKMLVKDASGKFSTQDGWFEFRTIPYGTYYMTSKGDKSDASGNATKLLDMDPMIVRFTRDEDNNNYSLEFWMDNNQNKKIDDKDDLISSAYSDETKQANAKNPVSDHMLTQSLLDQLADGVRDEVNDSYRTPGKDGEDVYQGEDHLWTRAGHKDVNADGSKTNNFISAEINIDNAGFVVNDKPNHPPYKDSELKLHTTATGEDGTSKELPANQKEAKIIDKVTFEVPNNGESPLEIGQKYTLIAQPMLKVGEGKLYGDKVAHTFVYNGQTSENVELTVSTMGLDKQTLTMFEYLFVGEVKPEDVFEAPKENNVTSVDDKAVHEDINDVDQTVTIAHHGEIGTQAYNTVDNSKFIESAENQQITDKIDISKANLQPGHIYKVSKSVPTIPWKDGLSDKEPVTFDQLTVPVSELTPVLDEKGNKALAVPYLKAQVKKDQEIVQVEKDGKLTDVKLADDEFMYQEGMNEVYVTISGIDMSQYRARQKVVMFEEIKGEDISVLVHADVNSEDQTVTTKPSLHTTFEGAVAPGPVSEAERDKIIYNKFYNPGKFVETVDHVTFRGVEPGKEQTIKGILMMPTNDKELDKQDGVEDGATPYLDADGKKVESQVTFTPTTANGIVDMYFSFVSAPTAITKIVAYESGYYTDEETPYATHTDINDEGQTITPKTPEIRTKATVQGQKTFKPAKDTPIHEEYKISNVVTGDNYKAVIKLWRVEGGNTANAKVVFETEKDFVAKAETEEDAINTIVDTSKDSDGTYYVWTEILKDGDKPNNELATHKYLNNKDQTVTVKVENTYAKTGELNTKIIVILGLALAGALVGYVIYDKKKAHK